MSSKPRITFVLLPTNMYAQRFRREKCVCVPGRPEQNRNDNGFILFVEEVSPSLLVAFRFCIFLFLFDSDGLHV